MSGKTLPWIGFLLLLAAMACKVWVSTGALPPVVASHFGPGGEPNGYMPRATYRLLMVILVVSGPLLLAGLSHFSLGRPRARINLPRADYWLDPARRNATLDYLAGRMRGSALLLGLFLTYTNHLVVLAQAQYPIHLDGSRLLVGVVLLLVSLLLLLGSLVRHFRRVPTGA